MLNKIIWAICSLELLFDFTFTPSSGALYIWIHEEQFIFARYATIVRTLKCVEFRHLLLILLCVFTGRSDSLSSCQSHPLFQSTEMPELKEQPSVWSSIEPNECKTHFFVKKKRKKKQTQLIRQVLF